MPSNGEVPDEAPSFYVESGNRRLTILQTFTAKLARITSSSALASVVLNEGVTRLGGSSGSLCLVSEGVLEIAASFGYSDDVVGTYLHFPIDDTTPAGESALTRLPVYCESLQVLYDRYPIFREGPIVGEPSIAVLPLEASDSALLGTMVIGFTIPQAFTLDDRELLEAIAREAAAALERARANEALLKARQEAETARDQLSFLADASASLAASLDLEETMEKIASLAVPRIADRCVLYLLNDAEEIQKFALAPEFTEAERILFMRRTPTLEDTSGVGSVIRTGLVTFVPEVNEEQIETEASSPEHLDLLRKVGFGGTFIAPLSVRGKNIGALAFVDRQGRSFTENERALAEELAARAAVGIDNARLFSREIEISVTLQRALLPAKLPVIPGVQFSARYVPGSEQLEVGGDWYSAIAIDENRFAIVVGDVSGRGLHAATTMASVRYTIRALAFEGNSPSQVLEKCNVQLDIGDDHRFATVLVGVVDLARRELTLANAGHLSPLLIFGDGSEYMVCEPGLPIGVRKDAKYSSITRAVPSNGMLLAFTDGLVERRGEVLDEGLQRLRRSALAHRGDADALVSGVLTDLTSDGPTDDIAILGVQWRT